MSGLIWRGIPAQGEFVINEIPKQGDKVTIDNFDYVFGNWSREEINTTSYNVSIDRTLLDCVRNLCMAINLGGQWGSNHLCRRFIGAYANQYGNIVHLVSRLQSAIGNEIGVSADAEGRITVIDYNLTGGEDVIPEASDS